MGRKEKGEEKGMVEERNRRKEVYGVDKKKGRIE